MIDRNTFELKQNSHEHNKKVIHEVHKETYREDERYHLLCKTCGNSITTTSEIISVGGAHRHSCTNPAGVTFQIGCFSEAEGCIVTGEPTREHTWFEGFSWQFAICSFCGSHLGWYYQSEDNYFFGLILSQLVRSPESRTHS